MPLDKDIFGSDSAKINNVGPGVSLPSSSNPFSSNTSENPQHMPDGQYSNLESTTNTSSETINTDHNLNPYEQWQKKFNERIEALKKKEADEIEKRTNEAAFELAAWHKNHKKQIEDKLQKLLDEEPSDTSNGATDFDWVTAAKYLETSEYFAKDQSGGMNQKLIELIMKKKAVVESSKTQPK